MSARAPTLGSAAPAGLARLGPVRSLAALVAALAVVVLVATTGPSGPELSLTGGSGPLSMLNSEDGALLTVGGMAPGDTEVGTVTVTSTGSVPGNFTVSSADLADVPGMGGGRLSDRLQLSIAADRPAAAVDETLFSGPLSAMERIELGWLAPGDARTFRFVVSFPNGGLPSTPLTGDNAYQGAQTSVGYRWDAVASSGEGRERGRGGSRGGSRRTGAPGTGAPAAEPARPAEPWAPVPAEPRAPVVLTARSRQRLTTQGVRVAMSCPGACERLSVVGVVRLPGGARTLRTRPVTVRPRSSAVVSVRLRFTPRAQRLLRQRLARGAHPVLLVRGVGVSPSGQRTKFAKRVVLLP